MSEKLSISINSEQSTCDKGESLLQILGRHNYAEQQGIAVAVNSKVVARSDWSDYNMNAGDEVLIVTASQGG